MKSHENNAKLESLRFLNTVTRGRRGTRFNSIHGMALRRILKAKRKLKVTMKAIKYIICKEGEYYVSQCLNVDVASFGDTIQEAIDNLNEAVKL